MLELTNPETAALFEAATQHEQWVWVPFPRGQGPCYKGFLSEIDPRSAERYVAVGGNLLVRKEVAASGGEDQDV